MRSELTDGEVNRAILEQDIYSFFVYKSYDSYYQKTSDKECAYYEHI